MKKFLALAQIFASETEILFLAELVFDGHKIYKRGPSRHR